jgi:hypothetical protein
VFDTGKRTRILRRPIFRGCNRLTGRYKLLCTECESAVVVPDIRPADMPALEVVNA